jgi:hypothetical protein
MNSGDTIRPALERAQRIALVAGIVGLVACGAGLLQAKQQFFQSYLLGFIFWAGISMGCLALLLLHLMFGAGWGFTIQRLLEAGTRTFPIVGILFLPILLGAHELYEWTHAEVVANDELLTHKSAYLNMPFFTARAAIYFAIWIGISLLMRRWIDELDASGDPRVVQKLRNLSYPGLIAYGLTASFAAVDWVMSLEPHWFSTIFGLIFIAGQVLATFALMITMVKLLAKHEPYAGTIGAQQYHDLGNLTLAFTMIWSYLSISQYLIIWSGNLPETITWFKTRSEGGWQTVAALLIALNFALPFLLLLNRFVKRRIEVLARVALLILVMRFIDLLWTIKPSFHAQGFTLHWLDVAAPIGIGGIWLWFFLRSLKGRVALPEHDPRMEGAFEHAAGH